MPPSLAFVTARWPAQAVGGTGILRIVFLAALNLAVIGLMIWSEVGLVPSLIFLLTWGLLNFFWLALLRRPLASAALALSMIVALILLSRLKYDLIWMTANFLDIWIVNSDTVHFLLSIKPDLAAKLIGAAALVIPVVALLWWIDPVRVRRRTATIGFAVCLGGLVAVSLAFPQQDWEAWFGDSYVSKFARSGVSAVAGMMTQGYLESDATVTDRLKTVPEATCTPAKKPPHILLVHDESSFDIRVVPGIKVPPGYGR